jgi:hypothetical protein
MSLTIFTKQIKKLRPEAIFTVSINEDGTYKILDWLNEDVTIPSQAEIDSVKDSTIQELIEENKGLIFEMESATAISNMTIDVDGVGTFNTTADDLTNLVIAKNTLDATTTQSVNWILADKSVVAVTVDTINQLILDAFQKRTELSTMPDDYSVTIEQVVEVLG